MTDEEHGYFKDRGEKKRFTIRTYDGRIYEGANLVLGQNTVSWIDLRSGDQISTSSRDVYQIVFKSKSAGFADGFGTGFVIGASVGGVLGYLGGEDCTDTSYICISRGGGAFLGVVFVGIPAGIIGGLIGVGKGSSHIYYFSPIDSSSVYEQAKFGEVEWPSN
jgi:hypothetical protein